ncbi:hypothetical protein ACJJTC_015148 [Scirpophaga incertulas]
MLFDYFWILALFWARIDCEPPVEGYLPPGGNNGRPLPVYGPARGGNDPLNVNHLTSRNSLNIPQDSYFPSGLPDSSSIPNTQYGPPGRGSEPQQVNTQFGSESSNNLNQPRNPLSSQYGTPEANTGISRKSPGQKPFGGKDGQPNYDGFTVSQSRNSNGFHGAKSQQGLKSESSYGPPPIGADHNPKGQDFDGQRAQGTPSSSYLSPSSGKLRNSNIQNSGNVPPSSYGTPDFGGSNGGSFGRSSDFSGEDSDEPAKYEFSYDVDDTQTGTKFHHSEQRDGDVTTGEYDVELPDGRKQVVEYESGLQGFKPQIRYEGGRNGAGPNFALGNGRSLSLTQGSIQGYPETGLNKGLDIFNEGDKNVGFPQPQGQDERFNKVQELNELNKSAERFIGYPRGGPQESNRQDSREFLANQPRQIENDQAQKYPVIDGENYNNMQNREGYLSGRPQGGRGRSQGNIGRPQGNNDRSYPNDPRGNGPSFNGQRGSTYANQGLGSRDNDGYPAGAPNGPRGSGY